MINVKVTKTPLPSGYIPQPNTAAVDPKWQQHFQQVIGFLLYLMLGTWPDILFVVIKMSQFMANPSQEHLDKVMHIFQYLASTQNYQLVYKGGQTTKSLMGFTDSDWAADLATHCSTTSYFALLASGIVCWQSRLQKMVTLSSTEAEYMALSDTCRQIMWMKSLFEELGFPFGTVPISGDNMGSIFIRSNPIQER